MEQLPLEQVVRNIDLRLGRVEQILPTLATREELREAIAPLATKEELREAIAPLATKEELRQAIAPLATKEELRQAIAEAVAPLATKEELKPLATKEELRREVRESEERTRRHFDIVAERLEGQIRLVAEGQGVLQERMDELRTDLKTDIARLDRRVMRLEVAR